MYVRMYVASVSSHSKYPPTKHRAFTSNTVDRWITESDEDLNISIWYSTTKYLEIATKYVPRSAVFALDKLKSRCNYV